MHAKSCFSNQTNKRVIAALDQALQAHLLHAPMLNISRTLATTIARFQRHKADMPKATDKSLVPPDSPLDIPALKDEHLCFSYEIARGEMGVLSFEPYKSLILPYWAFRTVPIAQKSAEILWDIFESYLDRGDLVGADMTRKFIQMGMTRARRYANHKGGRKYDKDGEQLEKWTGQDVDGKRKEKEAASEIFKAYWRRCIASDKYGQLKKEWSEAKKEYLKAQQCEELLCYST